ncbi:MAG: hypothetical protein V1792_25900 [Pseudomonadota bacterium]
MNSHSSLPGTIGFKGSGFSIEETKGTVHLKAEVGSCFLNRVGEPHSEALCADSRNKTPSVRREGKNPAKALRERLVADTLLGSMSARVNKMITRKQLRAELDDVTDKDLELLHRIIMAPASSPCSTEPATKPLHEAPERHRFIEDTYGVP